MNKFIINHNGFTFMRINKTKAKGVYQSGKPVAVVPHKMQPFHPYTGCDRSIYRVEIAPEGSKEASKIESYFTMCYTLD